MYSLRYLETFIKKGIRWPKKHFFTHYIDSYTVGIKEPLIVTSDYERLSFKGNNTMLRSIEKLDQLYYWILFSSDIVLILIII